MNKPKQPFADTEPASTIPLRLADDADFDAPTQPMPLPARAAPKPIPELNLSLAPAEAGEYELMAELRKDNRVCPLPTRWLEFYRILEDQALATRVRLPQPPITGSAWAATPDTAKRVALREQAEWAVQHGIVARCHAFLEKLPRNDWHYGA